MVVMSDMNARVGCDTSVRDEVFGRNGEEVCNNSGRQLLQFSSEHNLGVTNMVSTQENPQGRTPGNVGQRAEVNY